MNADPHLAPLAEADEKLVDDEAHVLAGVCHSPGDLQHASTRLRSSPHIVLAAVKAHDASRALFELYQQMMLSTRIACGGPSGIVACSLLGERAAAEGRFSCLILLNCTRHPQSFEVVLAQGEDLHELRAALLRSC